jgi:hypothetical protein
VLGKSIPCCRQSQQSGKSYWAKGDIARTLNSEPVAPTSKRATSISSSLLVPKPEKSALHRHPLRHY